MTVLAIDRGRTALPTPPPVGPTSAGIEALLAGARSEVLVMSTRSSTSRNPIGLIRRIDHENLRRGVRYRVLVPDPARTAPRLATQLGTLALAGAATRTVPEVPTDALVIDGTVAVLPVGADGTGTAVFRLPSVITTTVGLFERVWAGGIALLPADLPEAAELCPRELKLLSLLFSGTTDKAAAATLDVSVRTVRRMVRDLMNRLGARSRFQAGAKAAERGWLMDGVRPQR
jgi:DNA-binding CsgD family transcriptional regulator